MTTLPQAKSLEATAASPVRAPADSSSSGTAISLDRLTKVFPDSRCGDVIGASEISFDCRYGEVVGLLGPNGAGKTTTLRMLSTVLAPTRGTATVAGFDITRQALQVRRHIGYLSANTNLYERLTARETLEYFGRLHGLPEDLLAERVAALLERFDMVKFADVRCEKLSTGMRQKVSIARTVLHDPPVLILDEPTLGLDILVASTMIRFIEECRERGRSILFSTHILGEVEKLCDRVAVIHEGRLRAVDTLEALREQTGERYLEDVFVALLSRGESEIVP